MKVYVNFISGKFLKRSRLKVLDKPKVKAKKLQVCLSIRGFLLPPHQAWKS